MGVNHQSFLQWQKYFKRVKRGRQVRELISLSIYNIFFPLNLCFDVFKAVLAEGKLDQETTVMTIWPSPMIYGGSTEVQFHAKNKRYAIR